MITSSDKEYLPTKLIKQGKKQLEEPFAELAKWISERTGKRILNIVYDPPGSLLKSPRLQIIFEGSGDSPAISQNRFLDEKAGEEEIIARFRFIIDRDEIRRFKTESMFVVYSDFCRVAKEEADSRVTEDDIERLKKRLGNEDLWEIVRCFGSVTFMFYTDEQKERYEKDGLRDAYASEYFKELKRHDEFGYLSGDSYTVHFDSKQNFDENYQGSWFYYFR